MLTIAAIIARMKEDQVMSCLDETAGIEGWLFPIDALLLGVIDEIQERENIAGNLFEIGVHHGKSAILLARCLRPQEVMGVCDVFGAQDLNVDHSGEGSLKLFLDNMARFAPDVAPDIRVHTKRSEQLSVEETTSLCRLVHIDGGHRPADVLNDLDVAVRATLSGGVVVVDDAFNPSWPGVGEGLHEFLSARPHRLAPVIIGGNKVFLTTKDALQTYRPWLARLQQGEFFVTPAYAFEEKDWYGYPVLTTSRKQWVELAPIDAARLHMKKSVRRIVLELLAK